MKRYDIIIVGGGVVGLMLARELLCKKRCSSLLVLEKEKDLGVHASGRNSGVLHTGIYYANDSWKAKFCARGNIALKEYAQEHGIIVRDFGKVIVAQTPGHLPQLQSLLERAKANGLNVEEIDEKQLREIEPHARTSERALHLKDTASIDSKAVLKSVAKEISSLGGEVVYGAEVVSIRDAEQLLRTKTETYSYGRLINAAGVFADKLAHQCGVGADYVVMPFKGLYHELKKERTSLVKGHIYPTPNLNMPFLGVHLSRTYDDRVLVGPTAIPAFGRENYGLLSGMHPAEAPGIATRLLGMYWRNQGNFRVMVNEEFSKYFSEIYLAEVKRLCPEVKKEDLVFNVKVGIRAQLMNLKTRKLEMDFVLERGKNSTHVLNAISPAFTSSMPIAEYVAENLV